MATNVLSSKDIKRSWHLLDAGNKILGRVATEAAIILMGKNKANFVPYLDIGDFVVIVNAKDVKVSGKKEEQKRYIRHSGYPGGFREENLATLRKKKPEQIIIHAVKGMLPKTKLGRLMIKKLHVFAGKEHPFEKNFKIEKEKKS